MQVAGEVAVAVLSPDGVLIVDWRLSTCFQQSSCNAMQAAELRAAGQTAAALVCLQRLAQLDPDNGPAWYGRAKLHASLRQWPEAAAAYERAAKLQREVSLLAQAGVGFGPDAV